MARMRNDPTILKLPAEDRAEALKLGFQMEHYGHSDADVRKGYKMSAAVRKYLQNLKSRLKKTDQAAAANDEAKEPPASEEKENKLAEQPPRPRRKKQVSRKAAYYGKQVQKAKAAAARAEIWRQVRREFPRLSRDEWIRLSKTNGTHALTVSELDRMGPARWNGYTTKAQRDQGFGWEQNSEDEERAIAHRVKAVKASGKASGKAAGKAAASKKKKKRRVALTSVATKPAAAAFTGSGNLFRGGSTLTQGQQTYQKTVQSIIARATDIDEAPGLAF